MAIYEQASDTAKKIRAALKEAFPKLPARHFSVKSSTYSGGSSIDVHWKGDPSKDEVDAITRKFESAKMDTMDDYKDSVGYTWTDGKVYNGADFIFTRRTEVAVEPAAPVEPTARAHTPNTRMPAMVFAAQIIGEINSKWYGKKEVNNYILHLVTQENDTQDVQLFLHRHLAEIRCYVALVECVIYVSERRGFELENPITMGILARVARDLGDANLEGVQTRTQARERMTTTFIENFADFFAPLKLTHEDATQIKEKKELIAQNYPQFKDMLAYIPAESFIQHKRITLEKQGSIFEQHIQKELEQAFRIKNVPSIVIERLRKQWSAVLLDTYDQTSALVMFKRVRESTTHLPALNFAITYDELNNYCVVHVKDYHFLFHPHYVGSLTADAVVFNKLQSGKSYTGNGAISEDEQSLLNLFDPLVSTYLQDRLSQKKQLTPYAPDEVERMKRLVTILRAANEKGANIQTAVQKKDGLEFVAIKVGKGSLFVNTRGMTYVDERGENTLLARTVYESYTCFEAAPPFLQQLDAPLEAIIRKCVTRAFDLRYNLTI